MSDDDPPRTTAEWKRLEPRRVLVADLLPTNGVRAEWVSEKHRAWWRSYSTDVYPHVIRERDGTLRIADGHHRIARERELGRRYVWVRLFEQ